MIHGEGPAHDHHKGRWPVAVRSEEPLSRRAVLHHRDASAGAPRRQYLPGPFHIPCIIKLISRNTSQEAAAVARPLGERRTVLFSSVKLPTTELCE